MMTKAAKTLAMFRSGSRERKENLIEDGFAQKLGNRVDGNRMDVERRGRSLISAQGFYPG